MNREQSQGNWYEYQAKLRWDELADAGGRARELEESRHALRGLAFGGLFSALLWIAGAACWVLL